jgi:hypothetical protein
MERRKNVMSINLTSSGTLAVGALLPVVFTIWLTLKAAMRNYDLTSRRLATVCCILLIIAGYAFLTMIGLG